MERVTYILGAGFSAPRGLPVMSNFLMKAKDLYFSDQKRYAHFEGVFRRVSELSAAKNYFSADMWNIEEILSILEMDEQLGDESGTRSEFVRLLEDTVSAYTSPIKIGNRNYSNWTAGAFAGGNEPRGYGAFVAALLGIDLTRSEGTGGPGFIAKRITAPSTAYSVVTLNYDLVLEGFESTIRTGYQDFGEYGFSRDGTSGSCGLFKLHGSVDDGSIIPPTWNKSMRPNLEKAWKAAFKAIRSANHIRIIGYSLPVSDAYVRYLFKAAVAEAPHLKTIHVLTHDPNGATKRNYDNFVTFNNYAFVSARSEDYMKQVALESYGSHGTSHDAEGLEASHAIYFPPA